VYSDKLKKALTKLSKVDLAKDENKIKFLAVRTTANISALVRDLLRTPPQCKAVVGLSWKPTEKPAADPAYVCLVRRLMTQPIVFSGSDDPSKLRKRPFARRPGRKDSPSMLLRAASSAKKREPSRVSH
jgi:hypothetical protein